MDNDQKLQYTLMLIVGILHKKGVLSTQEIARISVKSEEFMKQNAEVTPDKIAELLDLLD